MIIQVSRCHTRSAKPHKSDYGTTEFQGFVSWTVSSSKGRLSILRQVYRGCLCACKLQWKVKGLTLTSSIIRQGGRWRNDTQAALRHEVFARSGRTRPEPHDL